MPQLSIIAAVATNNSIGLDSKLPWKIPEDMKFFRKKTLGKAVIMGRKTFQSLPHPLDHRKNLVLTRKKAISYLYDAELVASVENALEKATKYSQANNQSEICIIGGGQIYQLFLSLVDIMYITEVELSPCGDSFFPRFNQKLWHRSESELKTSKNNISFRDVVYTKK